MNMVFHKFFVIEFFINDHIEHSEGQRRICSGSELQPDVSAGGNPCESRVNRNKFCPFAQAHRKRLALITVRVAYDEVVAPHHDTFGMVFVINDWVCSTGQNACGNPGTVAEMPCGEDIGGAEQVGKAVNDCLVFPSCAVTRYD